MLLLQKLNVLIVGDGNSIPLIKKSRFLKKLYITSSQEVQGVVNITFNTFKELAQKCKALQIDIVFVENEKWILQGIADVLRKNFVNCIAPTAKFAEQLLDSTTARIILQRNGIDVPQKLTYPQNFPLLIRGKGFKIKVNSFEELLHVKEKMNKVFSREIIDTAFLEEFIEGDIIYLNSFYDGKTLKTFADGLLNEIEILEYSKALQNLLINEKANFIGFLVSKLLIKKGKCYNVAFGFDYLATKFEMDFLYLLNAGIYQKLNEV